MNNVSSKNIVVLFIATNDKKRILLNSTGAVLMLADILKTLDHDIEYLFSNRLHSLLFAELHFRHGHDCLNHLLVEKSLINQNYFVFAHERKQVVNVYYFFIRYYHIIAPLSF